MAPMHEERLFSPSRLWRAWRFYRYLRRNAIPITLHGSLRYYRREVARYRDDGDEYR